MTSKSKELDVSVKNMIIRLRNEGLTYRVIGVQLNISLFTVRSVVKKFKETGSTENKTRSGRPRIFSTREKRAIINKVKKNPKISAPQIARDDLKRLLLQEWHKIPNSTTKTLVSFMRNRLQAVIDAEGMDTKY
ncbi:hypothetical protein HNY73_011331 [Argiope bruennichi]|uniref:Paired domain-containing protein n=1 Tax=Argiope bruennichi TaxID=94029 RepID=A0A8T0F691_ARGBR|nr:hypothetical protein HNY73_011331 [Argiope bruennichi]